MINMEIRRKLTFQFIGMVALILLFTLVLVYFSFSQARKEEFYDRLGSKARLVAQMLIDIDEIDSELLKKIEQNNPLSLPNERIVIYDYNDIQIYSTNDDNELVIPVEKIRQVRLQEEVRFRQGAYEIFGNYYTGQYDRIVVFAAATDIFGINKLKRLRLIMLIVFVLSLGAVYFAGRWFALRALLPISKIVSQVNGIEVSNLNARLDEGNQKDEIAHLAQTFNRMLARIEKAFKVQKSFIANASHELRTPLTVITGQMEVVLMKERSNEEYRETTQMVLDEIKDLNLLSNKLLLLAQTSSEGNNLNFSSLRIDDILWKAQKETLNRNNSYSIDIQFGDDIDDDSKLKVFGNELLLKTALLNLIDNACKYSDNHKVDIHLFTTDNNLKIQFADQGTGIKPEELNLIFNPFFRSKNATVSGHGIGLTLVENIIHQHHGSIEVKSEWQKGSIFLVTLPVYSS